MLLILPLWTWLVACGQLGVAVVGYPVPVDRGCVLRKNSGLHQTIGLAMLTDLFGETLMTESNEKTYHVSICRRIPLNDSTSLAGAVKYNSKGEYVVLGEIDQAEVVVNKNTIVLTYIGSDVNNNFNEECHGNKWKTQLTFICDSYANKDTLKLVDEDSDHLDECQIKFEILTSKICRRDSSVVARTPTIQNKYNDLPSVINGSLINNTQYNNNVNDNNLNNYRHDGFVYIQNNSKHQKLHEDDSNNYIREPYYKRRLMMKTEILTLFNQTSITSNLTQEIEELNDKLTFWFQELILTVIPKPVIVAVGLALSLYYRWESVMKYVKTKAPSKKPESKQRRSTENTPLVSVKDTSNKRVTYSQVKNEEEVVKIVVEDNGPHNYKKEEETVSLEAVRGMLVKLIPQYIWIVAGASAVTITMLLLNMSIPSILFCLLWMWCLWKPKETSEENTSLVPAKDTSNEKVTYIQGKNEEEIASQGANGSTTVHVEQKTLSGAETIEETDVTTDVSGESKILKENDVQESKENELGDKKMDS